VFHFVFQMRRTSDDAQAHATEGARDGEAALRNQASREVECAVVKKRKDEMFSQWKKIEKDTLVEPRQAA
jgi:hypothetical protein